MKQKIRALFLWVMILSLVLPNIAFASANTGIDHSANIEASQATEEQIQTVEEQLQTAEEQLQTAKEQLQMPEEKIPAPEKLHLTEQYELTDEELAAYLAEHEPEAMPLEAPSTELEWMRYLSDAVKSALLNGDDTIDLAAYPYTRTTATQINFLDSYCPYTDRKDIQLRVYFNSQGKYAFISIENKKSAAATASWIQTVDAKLEHLMSLIADPALTAEDQMLILHDYMVSHYHYDTQYLGDSYNSGVMLTEWRGVCQAYATLFQYVMHRKGVECYITSNDGHAWNIVKIGNAYYHVDVTWDDPTEDEFGQVYHTFFLVNEEGIQVGGHENRDLTNLVCNSNTFATRYYKNAFSPVCINGNNRYYMSSGGLLCYNVANNVETVIDRLPYWYIWDTNVYYQVPFSGLFLYDGALYYNAPNSIRAYNLATGAVSTFATVDTTNGYIYGIFDADGLLYYTVGTEYDIPYYEKDIRTMALPTGHVHSFRQVSYEAPSCLAPGKIVSVCSICGEYREGLVPTVDHTFGPFEVVYDAMCYFPGEKKQTCTVCGTSRTEEIPAGHLFGSFVVTKAATCTEDGVRTSTCSRCGDKQTETIAKLSHDYATGYTVDVAATCTTAGSESRHCKNCSATTGTRSIAALGHSYGSYQTDTTNHWKVCSVCKEIAEKAPHAGGEATTTSKAKCATCGREYGSKLPSVDPIETPDVSDIFTDVPKNAWYHDSVQYVYDNGIMTGMKDTIFAPANNLSRSQFAMILYRLAGSPTASFSPRFKDVKAGQWYTDAVMWASEVGVITGYNDGTFGPAKNITREQIAIMLYRFDQKVNGNNSQIEDPSEILNSFSDGKKVSSFAREGFAWAVQNGIITGREKDGIKTLMPQNNASRAEAATMIMRYLQ